MLNFKEDQTYSCTHSYRPWWTVGKEYRVVRNKYGELCFVDDDGDKHAVNCLNDHLCQFKLKEKPIPVYTKDDLTQDALETTCTLTQVRDAIVKAYQLYDNDSQRLAYLKGYFDK